MDFGTMGERLLHQYICRRFQWEFTGGYVQRYSVCGQQSYKVSESFPYKWIYKKWREGFYILQWLQLGLDGLLLCLMEQGLLIRSWNWTLCNQVKVFIEDWDAGYRITSTGATNCHCP